MATTAHPVLEPVSIDSLRPTQITVGMREVKEKRLRWREYPKDKKAEFLGRHIIPVIFGPKERSYVVDHHHLARALHEEGIKQVLVSMVADLRALDLNAFWVFLDHRGWVYPYNADGVRQSFDSMIPSAAWLASYGAPADSPRTPRSSASSFGRTPCGGGWRARR